MLSSILAVKKLPVGRGWGVGGGGGPFPQVEHVLCWSVHGAILTSILLRSFGLVPSARQFVCLYVEKSSKLVRDIAILQ